DLAVQGRADIDMDGRLGRLEQIKAADLVGGEAGSGEGGERHRVPGSGIDRVHGGDSRLSMIHVIDPAVAIEDHRRIGGEDRIRPEGADLAYEVLTQDQSVDQLTV